MRQDPLSQASNPSHDSSTPPRRPLLTWSLIWIVSATLFAWSVAGTDVPVEPGSGQWVNVTDTELCQPTTTRVCGEFIDDAENSPYTGMFCCLPRVEVPLGLFSSCERRFQRSPRGDEEMGRGASVERRDHRLPD